VGLPAGSPLELRGKTESPSFDEASRPFDMTREAAPCRGDDERWGLGFRALRSCNWGDSSVLI
jgi:hypothetical protein